MKWDTDFTVCNGHIKTATISTEEYAYLTDCRVRLELLRDIRRKELRDTAKYGKPFTTAEDLVLGDDIPRLIEGMNHD